MKRIIDDDERVIRLLAADGPLYQKQIVDRTSWSKAKVSKLLISMDETGVIHRQRVGRVKVVSLSPLSEYTDLPISDIKQWPPTAFEE